jgi:hypothetical protein
VEFLEGCVACYYLQAFVRMYRVQESQFFLTSGCVLAGIYTAGSCASYRAARSSKPLGETVGIPIQAPRFLYRLISCLLII